MPTAARILPAQPSPGAAFPAAPGGMPSLTRGKREQAAGEPFRSAEQAWFWTMAALAARRAGTRAGGARLVRPCDPDDVLKCLDQLYRQRRIDLVHARILRIWGERGTAPNPAYASEHSDWRFWREAIDRLEWPLRVKGIVA